MKFSQRTHRSKSGTTVMKTSAEKVGQMKKRARTRFGVQNSSSSLISEEYHIYIFV